MKKKTMEKLYIKFRMFFIFDSVFWDKFDFYQGEGMSLRESYLKARYKAGFDIDYKFWDFKLGGYIYDSKMP